MNKAQAGSRKKQPEIGILALCALLCVGILISLAFLGSSIGQFSGEDTNVIPIFPPEEVFLSAGEDKNPVPAATEAEQKPSETTPAPVPHPTVGNISYTAGQPSEVHGDLQVLDDLQVWNSETHVSLFRDSYDGTVKSENGEKVVAPGTSNFYGFSVQNNGNVTMDYTVSLKVDPFLGEENTDLLIPIQWRLLSGDGTVVSDWKEYHQRTEAVKESTLAVRKQDTYTIEWRWLFDRGADMDRADTVLGNLSEDQTLGVDATIYIYAEQTDPGELPQTGDTSHIALYIVLMAVSACGIVILLVMKRPGKNDGDQ